MENIEDKFVFWCPLQKSEELVDPTTGEPIMRLGGIASTSDEDSDGEFLDPKGFDIKPLLTSGMVNWHHQAKEHPDTIIGEPSKAEIRPEGLYIETDLYPSSKVACDVWELANTLEKDSKTRRLGYSIEGKVIKRKSNDKPQIMSAVGNGSYLYRFNINEIEVPAQTEGEEPTKAWQYNEVVVWGPVTSDGVTKEVMNAMWSKDTEQKYINDYNAAVLGILDSSYIDAYKDFITQRKAIKEQIDKDYNEYINS